MADIDALAHTYWTTGAASALDALSGIVSTAGVSWDCIEGAIAAARRHGAPAQSIVVEIAAAHPAVGAERAWVWARGIDDPDTADGALLSPGNRSRAQEGALGNPHNGPRADELAQLRGHLILGRLLSNPATPTGFVDRHVEIYPSYTLVHPNCSPEHLRDPLGVLWPAAAGNPTIDVADALAFLRDGETSAERLAAAWHPELTDDQLLAVLDDEHSRPQRDRRLIATLDAVVRSRRWQHTPFTQAAVSLRYEPRMSVAVAVALAELTDDQRDAVRNMVEHRFDGTVADMLDVATTF
jgi:hypothetical protein